MPKQPKSRSLVAWANYEKRVADTLKHNRAVEAAKKKKKENSTPAKIRKIREKVQKMKMRQ